MNAALSANSFCVILLTIWSENKAHFEHLLWEHLHGSLLSQTQQLLAAVGSRTLASYAAAVGDALALVCWCAECSNFSVMREIGKTTRVEFRQVAVMKLNLGAC